MEPTDKRAAVIAAAQAIVAENGFHSCPTALIAARAEVGAGTIYRYFQSKEDLIREIFLEVDARVCRAVVPGHPALAGARERFRDLAGSFLRYLVAHPFDYAFLQQFNISPYGAALRRERSVDPSCRGVCTHLFTDILEQAVADGELKDLPILLLEALATGPILSVAHDV